MGQWRVRGNEGRRWRWEMGGIEKWGQMNRGEYGTESEKGWGVLGSEPHKFEPNQL